MTLAKFLSRRRKTLRRLACVATVAAASIFNTAGSSQAMESLSDLDGNIRYISGVGPCAAPCGPNGVMAGAGGTGSVSDLGGGDYSGDDFGGDALAGGPGSANVSDPAYIDSAVIRERFRIRFDKYNNSQFPDRAAYWYSPQAFQNQGGGGGIAGAGGQGIDARTVSLYYEHAYSSGFSVFGEVAVARFIDGAVDGNGNNIPSTGGLGPTNIGFKYGIWCDPCESLTFQTRLYIPTGDADRGLSNGVVSIEPALLYFKQLNDRWIFLADIRDWQGLSAARRIPGGPNYSGNVAQYGFGLGYDIWQSCDYDPCSNCGCGSKITILNEFVGWTVLDGDLTDGTGATVSATGDTIFNHKIGARYSWGDGHSLYGGYGYALTGDKWYNSIARIEYLYAY